MASKNFWKIVLFVFLTALILRIIFILSLEQKFYFDDEHEYWKMVDNFISGKGLMVAETLKAYRPPLYPLFLAVAVKIGAGILGIRIVQALIGALTCIFIYILSKKIFNEKVAIFSGFISAVYPFFIFYTGFLLTETLFIFLVVMSVLTIVNLSQKDTSSNYGLLAGIVNGFAGLCRPTMELFFPFCLIFVLFSKDMLNLKIKKIVYACLGFILVLTPWIIRNYVAIGKFVPGTTMGGAVFWEGNNPYSEGGPCRYFPEGIWQIEETSRDRIFYRLTVECIKKDPVRFVKLLGKKFLRFWNIVPNAADYRGNLYRLISVFSFGILLPFFIVGILTSRHNRHAMFLLWIIIFFTVFHMIFLASIRYRVAIEPFVIMLASSGFITLMDMLKFNLKT